MKRSAVSKKPKRKPKVLYKYKVRFEREVLYAAEIEVQAENEDVAKQLALNIADNGNPYSNRWEEVEVTSFTSKATKL